MFLAKGIVAVLVMISCVSVLAEAGPRFVWVEAERVFDDPPGSYVGAVKQTGGGASGGAYVTSGRSDQDSLSYAVVTQEDMGQEPLAQALISVRYSCSCYYTYFKLGKRLRVWHVFLDGKYLFPLVLPPTVAQEHKGEPVWGFASLPLGKLARGEHRVVLRPAANPWKHFCAFDGFYLHDGRARFAAAVDKENKLSAPTVAPPPEPMAPAAGSASAHTDALAIDEAEVLLDVGGTGWRFSTDPVSEGELNHWHEPAFDAAAWKEVALWKPWEQEGFPGYDGVGWYRRRFVVPETWRNKDVRLYVCRVNQYGWVYVNGRLVHVAWDSDTQGSCLVPGGISGVGSKSISDSLHCGQENTLAVKILNCEGSGGAVGPILLYATERFDESDGMFRLLSPDSGERYGVIFGYYARALTWPAGYHNVLLAKAGQHHWPAGELAPGALAAIPVPRHLMNRSTPLCIARKKEIERFLAKKPKTLDVEALSPFAMRTRETKIDSIRTRYPAGTGYMDVVIQPGAPFKREKDSPCEFSLASLTPGDAKRTPTHLHGKVRESEFGGPPVFHVDFPAEGEFSVFVEQTGVDACLEIEIDGRTAQRWELPSEGQPGSEYVEKYKMWSCAYNKPFSAPVAAGKHTICVRNAKENHSWIRVKEYRFSRYAKDDFFGLAEGKAGRYQTIELALEVSANYANPYDPDDISLCACFTAPSGRVDRVWAFFNQDFSAAAEPPGEEIFPQKGPAWKVRYTPSEEGEYTWFVQLDDGADSVRSERRSFHCLPSGGKGFVRVSKADPRYLECDDGSPFYILGVSGWPPQSLLEIDQQFEIQKQHSENFCFFPTFQWGELRTRPLVYAQMPFWRMDRILSSAEKRGICLQVFHDEVRRGAFEDKAFAAANGGPCHTPTMVYTNAAAREMTKNLARYIVARYAHSPNILLWGFGDEVAWHADPLMRKWIRETIDEMRAADPYQHIAIIGEGEKWLAEGGDMVDLGGWYVHLNNPETKIGVDIAAFIEKQIEPFRQMRKAVWSSEGGLCEIGPALGKSSREYAAKNKEMIHLHNQIWSSFMVGYCGGGSEWMRTLVNEFGQHCHHKAFAAYIKGEPLPSLGLETIKPKVSTDRLRVLGLRGKGKVFLWIQNRQNTWYKQTVEGVRLEEVPKSTVQIEGLEDGAWTIEWWDTYKGEVTAAANGSASNGRIEINVPPVLKDVACKLRKG